MKSLSLKKILFSILGLIAFAFIFFITSSAQIIKSAETSRFTISIVPAPQCFDGIDNDGDGFIDYPNDPDCTSYTDDNEWPDVVIPPTGGGGGGGGSSGGQPPKTGVTFSGSAYPMSKVTILKDGEIALQTIAGPDAHFKTSLNNLTPGNYNFTVKSIDSNGNESNPFSFPVYISKATTTDITGIFLAPTIDVDKSQVKKGEDLVIFGQTIPSSDVTIEVNSETQLFAQAKSDKDGVYLYNLNSAPLEYGNHSGRSKTNLLTGESSGYGKRVTFSVGNQNILKNKDTKSCHADLNNDGKVNLIDFSIAAFWYNKILSGDIIKKEIGCLNGDEIINLVDFSIMAFYWTG